MQHAKPVRLSQTVHGRTYTIEVLPVARDRWRAHILHTSGRTALMPFYGPTPDEATSRLTGWLSKMRTGE
jgi:hypothetical protein